jgi:hypothetical protein
MAMPAADSPIAASQVERKVLRGLCATGIEFARWNRLVDRLAAYVWRDPEHEVVYEALRRIRAPDAAARRAELPAHATRMGFPDVDWGKYLDEEPSDSAGIDQLIDHLEKPAV